MDDTKFRSLMEEHKKLAAEFKEIRSEFLLQINQMKEFNHYAKHVLNQSHDALKPKATILTIHHSKHD